MAKMATTDVNYENSLFRGQKKTIVIMKNIANFPIQILKFTLNYAENISYFV
jgi:hypothetical protein